MPQTKTKPYRVVETETGTFEESAGFTHKIVQPDFHGTEEDLCWFRSGDEADQVCTVLNVTLFEMGVLCQSQPRPRREWQPSAN
jgi:hypothetical protein